MVAYYERLPGPIPMAVPRPSSRQLARFPVLARTQGPWQACLCWWSLREMRALTYVRSFHYYHAVSFSSEIGKSREKNDRLPYLVPRSGGCLRVRYRTCFGSPIGLCVVGAGAVYY
jgi:hypothetical protein